MVAWTPQQATALTAVARWRRTRHKPVFQLHGYAGTGKTMLARHLGEGDEVAFAAFTGKAAHVMRANGCREATTIHALIYRLEKEDERGNPVFVLDRGSRARHAQLIVIDEASMVNETIGRDLLSFDVPVVAIADPAQLPPIDGCGFFTAGEPDVMLTEIHRQARDNPIIRMATTVREGEQLALGDYGESRVVALGDMGEIASDQILVGRNVTRRNINSGLRERRGLRGAYPLKGDKLVCLRNDYHRGFLNGSIWFIEDVVKASTEHEITLSVVSEEGGNAITATTHAAFFDGSRPSMFDPREYVEFDFGYALTVHKAQGSQWDSVLLHDESWHFREHHARWLYTGLTRAAKRVVVVSAAKF